VGFACRRLGLPSLVLLPLVALAVPACQDEPQDTRVTTLRLADGDYEGLAWGGTQAERFHVLARERTSNEVFLYSPDYPAPCSLGPLAWYGPHTPANSGPYALRSPSPPRIPIFETLNAEDRGTLQFVGLDCERSSFEVPDASPGQLWRMKPPDPTLLTFALREADRSLVFFDPWSRTRQIVAQDVEQVVPISVGVRVIEAGRVVIRDFEGKSLARFGTDVAWVWSLGATSVLYEDSRGIWLRQADDELEFAQDACAFEALTGAPQSLIYFSPCAARRLVVRTLKEDQADERLIREDVVDYRSFGDSILFTTQAGSMTRLFFARSTQGFEAELIGEQAELDLDVILYASGAGVLFTTHHDGDTRDVWYARLRGDGPALELVQGEVVELHVDADSFVTLDAEGTLRARGLRDLRGRLRIEDVSAAGLDYVFGSRARGLAYLTHRDAKTQLGRLELRFLELDEHFVIADDVREYRQVWWPERGLLYATGGARPGLHFARVEIPCEETADEPWACKF
jgi:hypothetical protein